MTAQTFTDKLQKAVAATDSLLCVGLDPDPQQLPAKFRSTPEPLLAWNREIIAATTGLACIYKPNIAFYEALGLPGYELLKATLKAIPPEIPVILDAKRGDIGSTSEAYARAIFDIWQVDAVTLNPYLGRDSLEPFLRRADKGIFILCHTSNPGAADFQELYIKELYTNQRPLYEVVAAQATAWNQSGNIGLVFGATYPEQLRSVRAIIPDMWFLVPGIGTQGGDLAASLSAGLTTSGAGVLINASRSLARATDIRAYAQDLVQQIRSVSQAHAATTATPAGAQPDSPMLARLAAALHQTGCVQFGNFTLHSGKQSPIYIDLRLLISDPETLRLAAQAYAQILRRLEFQRIASIPYAAVPIGTAVSLALGKPMIYPRKEVKLYGTGRSIEGHFQPGEMVVVLDDLITTGGSKLAAIEPLEAAGLRVQDIVVLINREQGGEAELSRRGYHLHAVLGIRALLQTLVRQERITQDQYTQVLSFLADA
ncbi:MAG: orotidine-5'-phosphate decarboxylase [Chloroflexi bacterium]|nr:orotidine-5'-phosphate decarboxylase [Chloroflexota bacterium]